MCELWRSCTILLEKLLGHHKIRLMRVFSFSGYFSVISMYNNGKIKINGSLLPAKCFCGHSFRLLHCTVFHVGSVRFGAVIGTEPHHRIFVLLKTVRNRTLKYHINLPNRTKKITILIYLQDWTKAPRRTFHSTAPHRRVYNNIRTPHQPAALK